MVTNGHFQNIEMKYLISCFFIIGSFCWQVGCRSEKSIQKNLPSKSFEVLALGRDEIRTKKDRNQIVVEQTDVVMDTTILNAVNAKIVAQAKKRENARKRYDLLMNSFKNTSDKFIKNGDYPDFFGGAYIDESDFLVVYIKGDSVKGKMLIENRVKDKELLLKQGKYSYKTLLNLRDKILFLKAQKANSAIAENIMSCHVERRENCVYVILIDCSEKRIEEFKRFITNSSAIRFMKYTHPLIINDDVIHRY